MYKKMIREYALSENIDDIGFTDIETYEKLSLRTKKINAILPNAKTIIVLAFNEYDWIGSESKEIAMNGRMDTMSFSRSANYKIMRFIKKNWNASVLSISISYPVEFNEQSQMGLIAPVSLRHAALAAGLGSLGRHNLVIHPKFGSRVVFSAVITDLEIEKDPMQEKDFCLHCGICVKKCPSSALAEEGKTDVMKCMKNSQPYGIKNNILFWKKYTEASQEDKVKLFLTPEYMQNYQAAFIGYQYFCFNCIHLCPVGK